jgi:hypothetical protein
VKARQKRDAAAKVRKRQRKGQETRHSDKTGSRRHIQFLQEQFPALLPTARNFLPNSTVETGKRWFLLKRVAFQFGKESIVNRFSIVSSSQRFITKNFPRLVLGFSLALVGAGQAAAQYGGGGGTGGGGTGTGTYTAPPGGYSSAKGAGIGAGAAAGVGVVFLALHYHGRVTGCVQPADDGLRLLDEKNNKSYALVPGDVYVKPGQRVLLKGKTSKSDGGTQTFTAKKLVKDLGSCGAPASAPSTNSSANSGSPAHQ